MFCVNWALVRMLTNNVHCVSQISVLCNLGACVYVDEECALCEPDFCFVLTGSLCVC